MDISIHIDQQLVIALAIYILDRMTVMRDR